MQLQVSKYICYNFHYTVIASFPPTYMQCRVWRENRERIVGWYDRTAVWGTDDAQWHYVWNPSCQTSMTLTGAAMFHKVLRTIETYTSDLCYTLFSMHTPISYTVLPLPVQLLDATGSTRHG